MAAPPPTHELQPDWPYVRDSILLFSDRIHLLEEEVKRCSCQPADIDRLYDRAMCLRDDLKVFLHEVEFPPSMLDFAIQVKWQIAIRVYIAKVYELIGQNYRALSHLRMARWFMWMMIHEEGMDLRGWNSIADELEETDQRLVGKMPGYVDPDGPDECPPAGELDADSSDDEAEDAEDVVMENGDSTVREGFHSRAKETLRKTAAAAREMQALVKQTKGLDLGSEQSVTALRASARTASTRRCGLKSPLSGRTINGTGTAFTRGVVASPPVSPVRSAADGVARLSLTGCDERERRI